MKNKHSQLILILILSMTLNGSSPVSALRPQPPTESGQIHQQILARLEDTETDPPESSPIHRSSSHWMAGWIGVYNQYLERLRQDLFVEQMLWAVEAALEIHHDRGALEPSILETRQQTQKFLDQNPTRYEIARAIHAIRSKQINNLPKYGSRRLNLYPGILNRLLGVEILNQIDQKYRGNNAGLEETDSPVPSRRLLLYGMAVAIGGYFTDQATRFFSGRANIAPEEKAVLTKEVSIEKIVGSIPGGVRRATVAEIKPTETNSCSAKFDKGHYDLLAIDIELEDGIQLLRVLVDAGPNGAFQTAEDIPVEGSNRTILLVRISGDANKGVRTSSSVTIYPMAIRARVTRNRPPRIKVVGLTAIYTEQYAHAAESARARTALSCASGVVFGAGAMFLIERLRANRMSKAVDLLDEADRVYREHNYGFPTEDWSFRQDAKEFLRDGDSGGIAGLIWDAGSAERIAGLFGPLIPELKVMLETGKPPKNPTSWLEDRTFTMPAPIQANQLTVYIRGIAQQILKQKPDAVITLDNQMSEDTPWNGAAQDLEAIARAFLETVLSGWREIQVVLRSENGLLSIAIEGAEKRDSQEEFSESARMTRAMAQQLLEIRYNGMVSFDQTKTPPQMFEIKIPSFRIKIGPEYDDKDETDPAGLEESLQDGCEQLALFA